MINMLLQRFYRRDETRGYSDRSNERPTDYKQGCNTHVFSQISRYQYPQQGRERAQTTYQRKRAPEFPKRYSAGQQQRTRRDKWHKQYPRQTSGT